MLNTSNIQTHHMTTRLTKLYSLESLELLSISVLILALPVIYVPLFINTIEPPKHMLLLSVACVLWAIGIVRVIKTNMFTLRISSPTIALAVLSIITLISLAVHPGARMQNFLHPFGFAATFALLTVAQTVLRLAQDQRHKSVLINVFLFSSISTGICSFFWMAGQIGFFSITLPQLPAGNLRTAIAIQLISVALACYHFMTLKKNNQASLYHLLAFGTALSLLSITTLIYLIKFHTPTMPYALGWQVMLEVNKHSPIIGTGPLSYEYWYNQTKPISTNISAYWNLRFLTAPNILLHFGTIYGLLGVVMSAIWLLPLYIRQSQYRWLALTGIAIAVGIFPPDLLVFFFLAAGTMLIAPIHLEIRKQLPIAHMIIFPLTIVFCLTVFWIQSIHVSWIKAELALARILKLPQEDHQSIRLLVDEAYHNAPYRDDILRLSSRITITQALQQLSQKSAPAEVQQTALTMINQGLQEARQAREIHPYNSDNSQNLANLYIDMIPFVDDSLSWAIQALEETYIKDPSNAFVRAQLGDLYTNQGNAIRAIQSLEAAVRLKPDYPIFYYALAKLYIAVQNYQGAILALQQTLSLIPADSQDAQRVAADIASIQSYVTQINNSLQNDPAQASPSATPIK